MRPKAAEASFGIRLDGAASNPQVAVHYPDVVLVLPQGRVAVELQLSPVSAGCLDQILAAYGRKSSIAVVLYLVQDGAIGDAVQAAAARLGLARLVGSASDSTLRHPECAKRATDASSRGSESGSAEMSDSSEDPAGLVTEAVRSELPRRRLGRLTFDMPPGDSCLNLESVVHEGLCGRMLHGKRRSSAASGARLDRDDCNDAEDSRGLGRVGK